MGMGGCRICFRNQNPIIDLFSEDFKAKELRNKIFLCFRIVLDYNNLLPTSICSSCEFDLEAANRFRLMCLAVEKNIDLYLKTMPDIDKDKKPTDEKILNLKNPDLTNEEMQISQDTNDKLNGRIQNYQCDLCCKIHRSKSSLIRHIQSVHGNRKYGTIIGCGEERRYLCTKCPYSTAHSQTLVNHMRRHNGERPYKCECGKSFTQHSSLNAHYKSIHNNSKCFTCATCGKQFKLLHALKAHQNVHNIGAFTCDICKKHLKTKQSLKNHINRHYNVHNYNCEECGITFVTLSELKNHKVKHNVQKQVHCSFCSYNTTSKKNLIVHLKRHSNNGKSFNCTQCNKTFLDSSNLHRHTRVHTRTKSYSCPVCIQKFAHSSSLNTHMRIVHNINYTWADCKSNTDKFKKVVLITKEEALTLQTNKDIE